MIFSFVGTAAITFFAIVVGYFTRSLPETLFNRVDFLILEDAEAAGRRITKVFGRETSYTTYESGVMQAEEVQAATNRSEALRAFILTLSDQQLVTGLAILIAGFSKYCSISTYHFNIAASLAWFSSTTHLSTLAVLRDYLISHHTIRTWRVASMFSMLCLLFPAVLVSWSYSLVGRPVQCAFDKISVSVNFINLASTFVVLVYLITIYGNKFVALYSTGSNLSMGSWFALKMRQKFEEFECGPSVRHDDKLIQCANTLSSSRSWVNPSRRYIEMSILILPELEGSFFWQILLLVFGHVYGITRIYLNRWMYTPDFGVEGDQNTMGFGQYVALLFLTLPLMAAREAYDG